MSTANYFQRFLPIENVWSKLDTINANVEDGTASELFEPKQLSYIYNWQCCYSAYYYTFLVKIECLMV